MSSVQERREQKREADLKKAAEQAAKFEAAQVSGQGLSAAEFEKAKSAASQKALQQAGFATTQTGQIVSVQEKRRQEAEKQRQQKARQQQAEQRIKERIQQKVPFTDDRAEVSARGVQPRPTLQPKQADAVAQGPVKDQVIEDLAFKEFQGPPESTKSPAGVRVPPFPAAASLSGISLLIPKKETKPQEDQPVQTPVGSVVDVFGRTPFEQAVVDPLREFREEVKPKGPITKTARGQRDVLSNIALLGSGAVVAAGKEFEAISKGQFNKVGKVGQQFFEREVSPGFAETPSTKLFSGKPQEIDITDPRELAAIRTELDILALPIGRLKGPTVTGAPLSKTTATLPKTTPQKTPIRKVPKNVFDADIAEPGFVEKQFSLGRGIGTSFTKEPTGGLIGPTKPSKPKPPTDEIKPTKTGQIQIQEPKITKATGRLTVTETKIKPAPKQTGIQTSQDILFSKPRFKTKQKTAEELVQEFIQVPKQTAKTTLQQPKLQQVSPLILPKITPQVKQTPKIKQPKKQKTILVPAVKVTQKPIPVLKQPPGLRTALTPIFQTPTKPATTFTTPPRTPPTRPIRFPFGFFLPSGGGSGGTGSRPRGTKKTFIASEVDPLRGAVLFPVGVRELRGPTPKVFKQIEKDLKKARKRQGSFDPILGLRGRKKPKRGRFGLPIKL